MIDPLACFIVGIFFGFHEVARISKDRVLRMDDFN